LNDVAVRAAGLAAYRLSIAKRRRIEANLAQWFGPGQSVAEYQSITRRVFYENWREILSWADREVENATTVAAVEVEGFEHLRRALDAGHGAILWESNGFGRRLLIKRVLSARGVEIHQVHGPTNLGGFLLSENPSLVGRVVARRFFDNCEKELVKDIVYIPHSSSLAFARSLIDRLRGASVVSVSGDGEFGRRRVVCEFLSGVVSFATGAVSLARLSGAPLLPVFCFQARDGRTRLVFEPPIPVPRSESREGGVERSLGQYAKLLESHVRRYPQQYRNWHVLNGEAASGRPDKIAS
jgi:KDO2-lipid IV(A) lauroyltransferase